MYLITVISNGDSNPNNTFWNQIDPSWLIFLGIALGVIIAIPIILSLLKNSRTGISINKTHATEIALKDFPSKGNVENVVNLSTRDVLEWFYLKKEIRALNKNNIAFTVGGHVESGSLKYGIYNYAEGKYNLIQGFYNKLTGEVLEYRIVKSEQIDDDLKKNHQNDAVNTYQ